MDRQPFPPDLYSPEALHNLAVAIGQFDDDKAFREAGWTDPKPPAPHPVFDYRQPRH